MAKPGRRPLGAVRRAFASHPSKLVHLSADNLAPALLTPEIMATLESHSVVVQ